MAREGIVKRLVLLRILTLILFTDNIDVDNSKLKSKVSATTATFLKEAKVLFGSYNRKTVMSSINPYNSESQRLSPSRRHLRR